MSRSVTAVAEDARPGPGPGAGRRRRQPPDVLTDRVADLAVGALIDVMRRMPAADRQVRTGGWARAPFPPATRVSGKRVGVLGLGRIGRAVARRIEGVGAEIAYCSRVPVPGVPSGICPPPGRRPRPATCSSSPWRTVRAPRGSSRPRCLTRWVRGLPGQRGQGGVVDGSALVAVVGEGRIAGAALEVLADEPRVPQGLPESDRVVLPYIASATRETREPMGDLALRNLERPGHPPAHRLPDPSMSGPPIDSAA
ncbi:NAD(P)-dependent oxidoreductase [Streptomyces sp. NEAU-W12]|uniref:NAD(P)-dependent oxidoreductase n=1 Tax=Streptomyces sp. NEAU-W12 TaxID=2994668 RepID=UPI00224B2AFB|nr:NAD(P)-dependent oxidoreductase [Streptomyces sp. NEAU-W12]MCX2925042.1 hypothetical protein [Streptomyces sp. NEAU-W12]